ncbi:MAG: MFS transporter [Candidatus Hodarchaeota archaeon]
MKDEPQGTDPLQPAFEQPQESLDTEVIPELEKGFFGRVKTVLNYGSYSVYLLTSWILGIFGVIIQSFLMLYLRDWFIFYIGPSPLVYIWISLIVVVFLAMELIGRFFGGYVGDNYNRKWLSVLTMFVSGIAMLILAVSTNIWMLIAGTMVIAGSAVFASGSTSYIYEQIQPEHSGLGMGIFQTGSGFGLIGIGLVIWLLSIGYPFVITIQITFIVGAICYILAAVIRAFWLKPPRPINRVNRDSRRSREFIKQNFNALKLLYVILPVFMAVLILDALSDGFYRFVVTYYLNEALAFSLTDIALMMAVVLAFSLPLSITVGGFFDRRGSRKAILIVYSVMPITMTILIIAPLFPYYLPIATVESISSALPMIAPLLSTPFIALAMKNINDILWWTLILTYLRKAIPRSETAKMLSIFFIVTSLSFVTTQVPAGFIYTFWGAIPVLIMALAINFVILCVLIFGNIEPKPIPNEYLNL